VKVPLNQNPKRNPRQEFLDCDWNSRRDNGFGTGPAGFDRPKIIAQQQANQMEQVAQINAANTATAMAATQQFLLSQATATPQPTAVQPTKTPVVVIATSTPQAAPRAHFLLMNWLPFTRFRPKWLPEEQPLLHLLPPNYPIPVLLTILVSPASLGWLPSW
jgi:hypothetical protein